MDVVDRVDRWERLQTRGAFLLPIVRSIELMWLALVLAATLFWANAPDGFLTRLAVAVWGPKVPAAPLFAPVLAAMALVLGFASGPYVEAARTIRRDSQVFSDIADRFLRAVDCYPVGAIVAIPDGDQSLWAEMRAVCRKSHDYMRAFPFDPADDNHLRANARALAHYWDKRAGATRITPDDVLVQDRYARIEVRMRELQVLVAIGLVAVLIFIIITARHGVVAWLLLTVGLLLLGLEMRAKRVFLPFQHV